MNDTASNSATRSARWQAAQRGLELGILTGLVVAIVDLVWTSSGRFAVSFGLVLAEVCLVVPVAALGGALLSAYSHWVDQTFPAERGWKVRLLANALVSLPFAAFALWVPASWIAAAWGDLRPNGRGAVVAALVVIPLLVVTACTVVRALMRRHAERRLKSPVLVAFSVLSALLAAMSYYCDATFYEGDYEDFHYGVNAIFVAATALSLGTARALLPSFALAARLRALPHAKRAALVLLAAGPLAAAWAPLGPLERTQALTFDKLIGTARTLTDIDGDGSSSLFGAADCSAFDAEISPDRQEIPANGRDEDCTGKDAAWPKPPRKAGKAKGEKRWNVVLIIVDALRADHLGLYGYKRPTSPTLDRLARKSLVFEQAFSQAPKTKDSVPSIMTGWYPSNVPRVYSPQAKKWSLTMDERAVPVTVHMKQAGYRTGAGVSYRVFKTVGLDRGFDSFQKGDADRAAAQFLADSSEPFFYLAHFHWPHKPYVKNPARDFGDTDLDRYDGEVLKADESIKKLLETLRERKLLDSTVIIVTADHGEEFGEHGGRYHTEKLYREILHVPLIVRVPGMDARRITAPVELVDIVPTIADLVGFELPPGVQDGQSLFAWPRKGSGGAYSEDIEKGTRRIVGRAFFDGRYRLVDDRRRGRRELFDHRKDRAEQRAIDDSRPDIVRRLQEAMSVRSLRRHTRVFERLTPETELETWNELLPTFERPEMFDLALGRLPHDVFHVQRPVLEDLRARMRSDPAAAEEVRKLLAPSRKAKSAKVTQPPG